MVLPQLRPVGINSTVVGVMDDESACCVTVMSHSDTTVPLLV